MRRSSLISGLSGLAVVAAVAMAGQAIAQPGGGYGGWMGPGMMYGAGPSPGWMGPGMMYGNGPGGWGPQQQVDLKLTVDQVKDRMEQWLQAVGNRHIKVGDVEAKDADTIVASIVTTDKDGLVQRYDVNRHSGFFEPAGG
jgi:hypothetical protein